MARFNTATATGVAAQASTHEGAPGWARDPKGELFLLAVAMMAGEDTFYEDAVARQERYVRLIEAVATADPAWLAGFVSWLRGAGNMRSAPLVAALEAARVMAAAGVPGARAMVDSVLQRADEPGEALAYWTGRYGRALPKPVKRGIADAVRRLYTQFALLRYDTASHGFRFGDVVELTHPSPATPEQGDLFAFAIARRHGRSESIPASLSMLAANAALRDAALADPTALLDTDALRAAGMTWEDALSLEGTLGSSTVAERATVSIKSTVDPELLRPVTSRMSRAALWEALIPTMGYMALLRNLRNFDAAGIARPVADLVARRLADADEVARSRQFPFRFLAAYREARALRWAPALEDALNLSLGNVPALSGRTLILVDLSGSMEASTGGARSSVTRSDVARIFGSALALRADDATLVWFDNRSGQVPVPAGTSLLTLSKAFPRAGGGTATEAAVRQWYAGHDRVVIVTDEQAHWGGGADVTEPVPAEVPVYTWNLGGYRYGHAPSGRGTRHTFGGLTDAAFQAIPLLERDGAASWPWAPGHAHGAPRGEQSDEPSCDSDYSVQRRPSSGTVRSMK